MNPYQEEREAEPIQARPTPAGSYYLQGFSDGYHDRPQKKQRAKEAKEAYTRGYKQGVQQRRQIKEKGNRI